MNIEIINPYTLKILISARKKDSINAISKRINLSYGWTYNWIKELTDINVFKLTRMNTYLNEDNIFYKKTLSYVKGILCKNISFYYSVLNLFGISYCFTGIDSVYMWTKGGYNISRFKDFYPIFIKVKRRDKNIFWGCCKKLGLKLNKSKGVFYKVIYLDDFNIHYSNGIPTDSLEETISFMQKNKYNFEPALEMIHEMYKKDIKIKYKEAITNV